MAPNASPRTLQEAILHYADPEVCQQKLAEARWPDGVICPHCGSREVGYLANQRRWQCKGKHPKRQFSAKVGTIFEDSPISLSKWFVAMWLIASAKNGISSYELHRSIGVTQKTAWFMLHRIRLAMQTNSFRKLSGEVEVDETYIGGKARNMHRDKRDRVFGDQKYGSRRGKIAVQGLLERHGPDGHSEVRTELVNNVRRFRLQTNIRKHVTMDGTTHVYTDALKSYERTAKWGPDDLYVHKVIDHAEAYVDGKVHTNGMENFWSLLKRAIRGTYVSVEPFHLFRYLDEQAYRFNSRKMADATRFDAVAARVAGRRLTYAALTGKPDAQSVA